jgi:O-acetyl-ADP-ribose deacetylase (regulator of RNase III)
LEHASTKVGLALIKRLEERSIRHSVRNAIRVAEDNSFQSIAFPLIGAGSGGFDQEKRKEIMLRQNANFGLLLKATIFLAES